ncbi:hypothetical protein BDM02DRAFT_3117616 [Thelephora ganbajun]|uniref:Uncharacterized protein n=1 Tax=Thelephora ganbajun TaxID=370292 RepID=A0ACB6ZC32_THEGA|nr:hypothetical protein BDM02DRAFT_3117616 [Thelephora ganbajun]
MSILSIILPAASLPVVRAAPWQTVYARQSNGNNANAGFSSAVWIPIVAIGVLFFLGGLWVFRKKIMQRRMATNGNTVSNGTNTTTTGPQTRELTAVELANGTRPTTTTTRRPRRPRRTPSQVSTKSLPAYMKEPGDHEVVIYRGLEDMDEEAERNINDSTTTTPDMALNTEGADRNSHDITRALLPSRTDSPELIRHSINLSRGSYDHQGSDESHARLIDVRRGEAPAYESIDLGITEEPAPAHRHQNSQSTRISGFFSRFMPHRGDNDPTDGPPTLSPPSNARNSAFSHSHSREPSAQSGTSGIASTDSHSSPRRSGVGRTHQDRNNNSSTGSVFTILSRTLSRNLDDVPLTSPSMISLNSISPPLTHTATRTEFTYPRTGPTFEQIKFLSSKETFGRFGLPYGPDAVAFAASSSRQDLPPDFDSIHRPSFSDPSPNPDDGSGFSLRRSTSASRVSAGDNPDRGGSPFPESGELSPDLASLMDPPSKISLSKQKSSPNLGADVHTSPSQNSLSKQKSTPNLGVGHPPLSKSALKSKSITNLQSDGDGSLPPRSVSAAGSYLTVESFQTAHDDGGDPTPTPSTGALGSVPQIMVQLPSNNPSSTNLAEEGSGSETEEFFDGDEGTEGSVSGDEDERGGVNSGGNKTPRVSSVNEGHQSHVEGWNQEEVKEDDVSSLSDEDEKDSSASEPNTKGHKEAHMRTPTSSSSSDPESGSDDESEAETHSTHTEVNQTLVTMDLETGQIRRIHGGTDVTLTPEMVTATLKTSSPDLTRTTAVGA